MRFPVNQPYKITTYFDINSHPGIDIAPVPAGSQGIQCYAPEAGSIIASAFVAALEGNYVKMRGDSGMYYYFGHFSRRLVDLGQRVAEGTVIGILGMTGKADGIHTHHEVRRNSGGDQIDPVAYYKGKEGVVEPTDYRMNQGDVINGFKIFGRVPSELDLGVWTGQPFKKFMYEKIMEGVALMPPAGVKPYSGPPLFVETTIK